MKRLIFTVTNGLNHDQRMIRICTTLAEAGYKVTLVGCRLPGSAPLAQRPFGQKRLFCPFKKGPFFYAFANIRLFFYLLLKPCDVLCCIDLDTMLPVYAVGRLRRKKIVYDAHEYFSQQKEVVSRPRVYRVWHWIERTLVPRIPLGYTVSHSIAAAFAAKYGVGYEVIMNCTVLQPLPNVLPQPGQRLLYQGAVNEARGLEHLIPAMRWIEAQLYIYGDGNFMEPCRQLIRQHGLEQKVFLMGQVLPEQLSAITASASIGLNLVENNGLNQYFSLANKFFDYLHQALPQISMDYPEYRRINDRFEVALLITDVSEQNVANAVNHLLMDTASYRHLQRNCLQAREIYCWQNEAAKLLTFYQQL